MNILFVNEIPMNPLFGGIERVTDLLTKELITRGHKVYYLCSRIDNESMLGYEFPAEQLALPTDGGFSNEENIQYYEELLKTNKIDIVVNQRGWAPFMNNVLCCNTVKTVSVIHSTPLGFHVMYMKEILRHNKTFDGISRYIIKLIVYPFYYAYKYITSLVRLKHHYYNLVKDSSAVVLLSDKCRQDFKQITQGYNPSCPIYSIPNPNVYINRNTDLAKKDNIILYVGRLCHNQKQPERMLKVWERIFENHQDWKLIFVGEGDALDNMKLYAQNKRIERVEFAGKKDNVEDYYSKASFICLTSDFEGWGMTLTEGMSFGCIPVTFNNYGAASEIIDDQINGCLIPPFNLKTYAERLSELMNNQILRETMSKAAIEKVETFSVGKVVDQWENLFNQVLAQH